MFVISALGRQGQVDPWGLLAGQPNTLSDLQITVSYYLCKKWHLMLISSLHTHTHPCACMYALPPHTHTHGNTSHTQKNHWGEDGPLDF